MAEMCTHTERINGFQFAGNTLHKLEARKGVKWRKAARLCGSFCAGNGNVYTMHNAGLCTLIRRAKNVDLTRIYVGVKVIYMTTKFCIR